MERKSAVRISDKLEELLRVARTLYEAETGRRVTKAEMAEQLLHGGILRLARDKGWSIPEDLL